MSSKQADALRTELDGLNTSLASTNAKLAGYSQRLQEYETRLRRRARIIAAGAALLLLAVLTRIFLCVLKMKFKVEVPYWLNLWI